MRRGIFDNPAPYSTLFPSTGVPYREHAVQRRNRLDGCSIEPKDDAVYGQIFNKVPVNAISHPSHILFSRPLLFLNGSASAAALPRFELTSAEMPFAFMERKPVPSDECMV
ncbi:hypothetical protein PACILC2_46740 [Paenibacillus cisolokensis]|uniref:Uncharacterized protein n=1 Tax=Paenibacillus cisolokensis TaxID=1658519 RepID=A0ABQ4NE13_9BACL|nr:hypothetical protein [Paenibacillus cisolokensis]GIQ66106.1 hypothetical protein PACILC2_46740 [Paenibacillus cisolokensis]